MDTTPSSTIEANKYHYPSTYANQGSTPDTQITFNAYIPVTHTCPPTYSTIWIKQYTTPTTKHHLPSQPSCDKQMHMKTTVKHNTKADNTQITFMTYMTPARPQNQKQNKDNLHQTQGPMNSKPPETIVSVTGLTQAHRTSKLLNINQQTIATKTFNLNPTHLYDNNNTKNINKPVPIITSSDLRDQTHIKGNKIFNSAQETQHTTKHNNQQTHTHYNKMTVLKHNNPNDKPNTLNHNNT